jgi:hypothetical protein
MSTSTERISKLARSSKSEDFRIGEDDFRDLQITSTPAIENFYYFYDKKHHRLIKQFVLDRRTQVDYLCVVTLIKKEDKFTPRLSFSVRDKAKQITEETPEAVTNIRSNVSLEDCHETFWKLISFLQSLREIDIPTKAFRWSRKEKLRLLQLSRVGMRRALSTSFGNCPLQRA